MSEALSALKLRKRISQAHAALGGIPQATFSGSSAYNEIRLSLYPILLAMADKLATLERETNEIGAAVADHDDQLQAIASDFVPSVPALQGILTHLVKVDELIGNVHALTKAQIAAMGEGAARVELEKAQRELLALGEENAQAIATVKQLIADAAEPEDDDEPDEGGDEEEPDEEDDDDDEPQEDA